MTFVVYFLILILVILCKVVGYFLTGFTVMVVILMSSFFISNVNLIENL
jgi:hypothetical protein